MRFRTIRRSAVATLTSFAAVSSVACGDARINKLSAGISRDSALKVINEGSTGDSLARVYKQETYLIDGRILNVLFYNKDGVKQEADSTLDAKMQTPIVSVADTVKGWGWAYYDSVAKANNIIASPRP